MVSLVERQVRVARLDAELPDPGRAYFLEGARHALATGRIALIQLEWNDLSRGMHREEVDPVDGSIVGSVIARSMAPFLLGPTGRRVPKPEIKSSS